MILYWKAVLTALGPKRIMLISSPMPPFFAM